MASATVWSCSASSSGISMPNSSSNAMTSSTVSSESAPRSSTNDASGVTFSGSTPSSLMMISLTFASMLSDMMCLAVGVLHDHAAIDHDHLAGNVTRARACKKPYDPGHVLCGPESSERDLAGQCLAYLRRQGRRHLRLDVARRHRVAQHAAGRQFLRHRFREPDEPGL